MHDSGTQEDCSDIGFEKLQHCTLDPLLGIFWEGEKNKNFLEPGVRQHEKTLHFTNYGERTEVKFYDSPRRPKFWRVFSFLVFLFPRTHCLYLYFAIWLLSL
jgi:hypothetical protein